MHISLELALCVVASASFSYIIITACRLDRWLDEKPRARDRAVKTAAGVQEPRSIRILGEVRLDSIDDLYAAAGLTEAEEWDIRRRLAHARARLFSGSFHDAKQYGDFVSKAAREVKTCFP